MKKFTFLFTMLLLALVGSAATVTDVLTATGLGLKTSYTDRTHDFGGRQYISNAYLSAAGGIQMRGSKNSGLVTTQSDGYIRSVNIVVEKVGNTIEVYGSNTAYTAVSQLYATETKGTKLGSLTESGTVTVEGDYKYVAIRSNNNAIYMTSIELEWETSSEPVTPTCSAPEFSLAAGTYYGLEGYTKKIELTCGTEGAKIFYAQYDATTTTDPSTIPAESFKEYTAPIEITCAGEYSVAAYAKCDGYNDSGLAKGTWKYEILEAEVVNSIAEFIAVDPETATTTVLNCPLYVTACSGKYLYVRDDAGDAILVYGTIPAVYANGTQFEAGSIAGKYTVYNGMKEVASPTFLKEPLSELATDKTQPLEVALEDVTTDIQNQYVTIKGVKFNTTDAKLELGETSVAYYAKRFNFTAPDYVDAPYSVTCVVEVYNNNVQVSPISFSDESPEQVYIVGEVSDEAGNYYGWAPNKGIALTKVYPGVYNGKIVVEHDKYYAVFTALGADENDWKGLNANKYGLSNQNNVVMNKELPLLEGNDQIQMHQFYSGTFDVTVDLNKMTIKYSTENGYPEQLRIIGNLRMPDTHEEVSWNTAVNEPFIANGSSGVYHFDGVVINKGGGFTFTAAVDATEWDGDGNINSWRIGPASAENGANILNQDGTVELLQWQSSNNIFVNPEDFKSTDPAYEDYAFAEYNLTVDLGAGTVTSDPTGFTGTEKIEIKGANVEVSGGTIIVSGAASIYNAAGQAIAINSKAGKFNVPAGLYFVRVDGKVTKVLVR